MSLLNGDLTSRKALSRKSTSSRITAPNGSVISNASSAKASTTISQYNKQSSNAHNSPKSGSIISKAKSETVAVTKHSKAGSVVSAVSSQVARRKKKREAETTSLATRSMSASALGRTPNEVLYGDLMLQQKSQSAISLKIAEEIQTLKVFERDLILEAIKKSKQSEKYERRRKEKLENKIFEIKNMRPPNPLIDLKMCYICTNAFWPIFSMKVRCCKCRIFVCRQCYKEYKIGNICSNCAFELLYTAQLAAVFNKETFDEDYSDGVVDMLAIENMIIKTSESEARRSAQMKAQDQTIVPNSGSRSRVNSQGDLTDLYDNTSIKSKSILSMFSGLSNWNKKKKESLAPSNHRSILKDGEINEYESMSKHSKTSNHRSTPKDGPNNDYDYMSAHSKMSGGRPILRHEDIEDEENKYSDYKIRETDRSLRYETYNEQDNKSIVSMAMLDEQVETTYHEADLIDYGAIMVGLSYNYNKKEFVVIIKKCRDLFSVLGKYLSNPFVQVVLIPEIAGEPVRKTSVKNGNLNPIYNEQCKFKNITYEELVARTVMLTVIHNEFAGKNIFMGNKLIELGRHSFEDATAKWYDLEEDSQVTMPPTLSKYYGDIKFSIKYTNPLSIRDNRQNRGSVYESASQDSFSKSSGKLIIWLIQANNLFSSKYNKLPDVYVSCSFLPKYPDLVPKDAKKKIIGQKSDHKWKSIVVPKSLNPVWKKEFTFSNISYEDLINKGVELTVWDKRVGLIKDVFMGGISMNTCRKSKFNTKDEKEVWDQLLAKPEVWIEASLVLRTDIR